MAYAEKTRISIAKSKVDIEELTHRAGRIVLRDKVIGREW